MTKKNEQRQALLEYSLILVAVLLGVVGLIVAAGGLKGAWKLTHHPVANPVAVIIIFKGSPGQVEINGGSKVCAFNLGACAIEVTKGSDLTLRAIPTYGSNFMGWDVKSGCGPRAICRIGPVSELTRVTATFAPPR